MITSSRVWCDNACSRVSLLICSHIRELPPTSSGHRNWILASQDSNHLSQAIPHRRLPFLAYPTEDPDHPKRLRKSSYHRHFPYPTKSTLHLPLWVSSATSTTSLPPPYPSATQQSTAPRRAAKAACSTVAASLSRSLYSRPRTAASSTATIMTLRSWRRSNG
jgi:hypothetical protein